jgi:hypothetical protein
MVVSDFDRRGYSPAWRNDLYTIPAWKLQREKDATNKEAIIDAYNQKLLKYYRSILTEIQLIGTALSTKGVAGLQAYPAYAGTYPTIHVVKDDGSPSQTTLVAVKPGAVPAPFPKLWPQLSYAIHWSLVFYTNVTTSQRKGDFTIGYGYRVPLIQTPPLGQNFKRFTFGVSGRVFITPEGFYGPTDGALELIIHEPYHDLAPHFLSGNNAHKWMRDVLPTDVGPTNGARTDAWSLMLDFLRSAEDQQGVSLWQKILKKVGPRPTPPPGSGIVIER